MSNRKLSGLTLLVPTYDAGIGFFVDKLGFDLLENTDMGGGKRWVVVAPSKSNQTRIILAQPSSPEQQAATGNQTGGRVGFFLETDDFEQDHAAFSAKGVVFTETPRVEVYGKVAVFQDDFGNLWDLIQPA
ncbi:MAG: VOC family protein [Alphaproteobacteria bacterium]